MIKISKNCYLYYKYENCCGSKRKPDNNTCASTLKTVYEPVIHSFYANVPINFFIQILSCYSDILSPLAKLYSYNENKKLN